MDYRYYDKATSKYKPIYKKPKSLSEAKANVLAYRAMLVLEIDRIDTKLAEICSELLARTNKKAKK